MALGELNRRIENICEYLGREGSAAAVEFARVVEVVQ
jgi:hypothetical protein